MMQPNPRPTSLARGLAWDYAGTAVHMGSQVIVLMALSRLLSPTEFGIAALVTFIAAFGTLLSQFGIVHAVVQSIEFSEKSVRTAFTLTVIFGVLASAVSLLLSSLLAVFFDEPELGPMLRLISPYFLFVALGSTSEALLQRSMDFRRLAIATAGAYIFGYGLISVWLASLGWGVKSLMIALVAQALTKSVVVFLFRPHSVMLQWDYSSARHLMRFGGGVSLSKLLNSTATQGDNAVVGRILGANVLGIYSRAYQLILLPANFVGQTLNKVLFAAWSTETVGEARLRIDYLRVTGIVALVSGTFAAIYLVLGPEIILVLLGRQWVEVWPPLQVLAFALIARTAYKVDDSLAIAKGFVRQRIYRDGVYAALAILFTLSGGIAFGIVGAATGISAAISVNYLLAVSLSLKVTKTAPVEFITTIAPGYFLAALFGLIALAVKKAAIVAGIDKSLSLIAISISASGLLTALIVLFEPRLLGPLIRAALTKLPRSHPHRSAAGKLIRRLADRLRP